MKKLNNKGYMLVEIILAFVIMFGLIYFLMDLVINLKNKNDDLVVDTIVKTDQTIISNKLMEYIIEDTSDADNIKFSCNNIDVDGNVIKYKNNIIGIVDDTASISYEKGKEKYCYNKNGKIHINIPVEIKQMSNKNYDIVVDYRYKLMYCNPVKSYRCANGSAGSEPYTFTYTGKCSVSGDNDNWKIKFLTSGTFKSSCDMMIDIFLVGGGGGGGTRAITESSSYSYGGGGGGGGYTVAGSYKINSSSQGYNITIGAGGAANTNGEDTIAFNAIAKGGKAGTAIVGGSGGSGGGAGGYGSSNAAGNGGSNGNNGNTANGGAGSGQGTTTCEFGENGCATNLLYAGGGGGGAGYKDKNWEITMGSKGTGGSGGGGIGGGSSLAGNGVANTGGGGGGGSKENKIGGSGGSGIVVIRNAKTAKQENMPSFSYNDGYYLYSDDGSGNWKIKFLTSGTLIMYEEVFVDTFLVGGGGGGGTSKIAATDSHNIGGGGGGGGYTITGNANLISGKNYKIVVGKGGETEKNGEATTAFSLTANGGAGGSGGVGGTGGSGGGGGGQGTSSGAGAGGNNGNNGGAGYGSGGNGQGTSTCEFGLKSCTTDLLYAGGGGGGAGGTEQENYRWNISNVGINGTKGGIGSARGKGADAPPNGGGGGGGGARKKTGGAGGSGIVVIKKTDNIVNPSVNFEYDGNYRYIDDGNGNWRIKFLSDGTLKVYENLKIDAFLVGGGGGGGESAATTSTHDYGGGGGGGGYTVTDTLDLIAGTSYKIFIGKGGETEKNGEATTAFSLTANGGIGSINASGGRGGSGGGGGGEGTTPDAGAGGSIGGNGVSGYGSGGIGQGTSTCEFGVKNCTTDLLYAGGGGGGAGTRLNKADYSVSSSSNGSGGSGGGGTGGKRGNGGNGEPNTGGGGGGSSGSGAGGTGGSGIVVIRNAR